MIRISFNNTINKLSEEFLVTLPNSKSIANRQLIINFLKNADLNEVYSRANDTLILQKLLQIVRDNKNLSEIVTLNAEDAGSTFRFLTALLSITPGKWLLTGNARMKERPIEQLVKALNSLGAEISYVEKSNFAPLLICGKDNLFKNEVEINSDVSSQFISALMLIAPIIKNGLKIILNGNTVSKSYISLTQDCLIKNGANVIINDNEILIQENFNSKTLTNIEGDWSSAAYWYQIASLLPNSRIVLTNLNKDSKQGDTELIKIFENFGVATSQSERGILISNKNSDKIYFEHDFTNNPDIVQATAVVCCALNINASLRGVDTLRYKETDRINALLEQLTKIGFNISYTDNALIINKLEQKIDFREKKYFIETYNDHRMAMAFCPLAILGAEIQFPDEKVVNKSYPDFWNHIINFGFSIS